MARGLLVGDIGGTHARFGIAEFSEQWHLTDKCDMESGSASFEELLQDYVNGLARDRPLDICLAVAGPVVDRAVVFTNRRWRLSEAKLLTFGFARARLLNDFAALAFAAPQLTTGQLFALGPGQPTVNSEPIAVMGAGTGFGASCLVRHHGLSLPLACEAGHIGFAPNNVKEDMVLKILRATFGRVSVERVLSGPGLENLLSALQELDGSSGANLDAAAIMQRAEAGNALCQDAVALFCSIYGSVAGDIALAQGARGGVYLAGGIAPKIKATLAASQFRQRFEDKGRLSYYMHPIPTCIITDPDATLIGAALAFAPGTA